MPRVGLRINRRAGCKIGRPRYAHDCRCDQNRPRLNPNAKRRSRRPTTLSLFFASPNFGSLGESVVIVRDPEHDCLSQSVLHAVSKQSHFLSPLTPMIRVISYQALHSGWFAIRHWTERQENLAGELAHSKSRISIKGAELPQSSAAACGSVLFGSILFLEGQKKGGDYGVDNTCFG